jgi:hypothetical protein
MTSKPPFPVPRPVHAGNYVLKLIAEGRTGVRASDAAGPDPYKINASAARVIMSEQRGECPLDIPNKALRFTPTASITARISSIR